MARKLKTYQTSVGFFDMAIAAPSMKAALEAWGAKSNLFHQGFAKEVDDPEIVAAAMSRPGVVLRRPVGSNGSFREDADLPEDLSRADVKGKPKRQPKPGKRPARKVDDKASRKAALAYEKDQKRRENERRKEEAPRAKERERREQAIAKAEAAIEHARQDHDERMSRIDAERAALEMRSQAEDRRWEKLKENLDAALRRARG